MFRGSLKKQPWFAVYAVYSYWRSYHFEKLACQNRSCLNWQSRLVVQTNLEIFAAGSSGGPTSLWSYFELFGLACLCTDSSCPSLVSLLIVFGSTWSGLSSVAACLRSRAPAFLFSPRGCLGMVSLALNFSRLCEESCLVPVSQSVL